jgi:hypothetical protein
MVRQGVPIMQDNKGISAAAKRMAIMDADSHSFRFILV